MDLATARDVLGVDPDAPWPDVRAAYLRMVREHHPDTAPDAAEAGIRTVRTAQITSAYSALLANRPATDASPPVPGFAPRVTDETLTDALDGTRRVLLAAELDDAFVALLEVAHIVGVVSYVDRQSAVLESIVTAAPGEATSLLIFLEPGEAEGITEAFLGVEPLGGHAPAPHVPLVDRIAELLARPRPPVPDE
ncbi:MAG: J domain-containing protein [Acidimicrobiia bacterium]